MVNRKTRRPAAKPIIPAPKFKDLPEFMQELTLEMARGDLRRITVVTTTEVVIENNPKGEL
jgi:hypothetical protein